MSYNICKGGKARLPVISDVIKNFKPDILGLSELFSWDQEELSRFADSLGFSNAFFGKANTNYNLGLLGRALPVRVDNVGQGFWHTLIRAVYQFPKIGEVALFLVHLNPKDEDARLEEIKQFLYLAKSFSRVILMGDLNSLSPHDPYDRKELLVTLRAHDIKKFGVEALRFDCVNMLESNRLVDVMTKNRPAFQSTVPTLANQDPAHAVPLRLDYLFVSPALLPFISSARVIVDERSNQASDHYPIILDLDL